MEVSDYIRMHTTWRKFLNIPTTVQNSSYNIDMHVVGVAALLAVMVVAVVD